MTLNQAEEMRLDEIDIEDQFADLAADLVSLEAHHSFIKRLLALDSGQWRDTKSLCDRRPIIAQLEALEARVEDSLQVCWLEHPLPRSGYCFILFYVNPLQWDSLALYNKQLFLQKLDRPVSSVIH
jgi:hypothetical protein